MPSGESGTLSNGKRFVVHADEKLSVFVELESGDSGLTREGGGLIAFAHK
jgi:uncharacterized protein (DUF2345 family)